jgi:hypothetical protein
MAATAHSPILRFSSLSSACRDDNLKIGDIDRWDAETATPGTAGNQHPGKRKRATEDPAPTTRPRRGQCPTSPAPHPAPSTETRRALPAQRTTSPPATPASAAPHPHAAHPPPRVLSFRSSHHVLVPRVVNSAATPPAASPTVVTPVDMPGHRARTSRNRPAARHPQHAKRSVMSGSTGRSSRSRSGFRLRPPSLS